MSDKCYKDGHYIPARENGHTFRFDMYDCPYCKLARLTAALSEATATLERYREALRPFANYACDPPCGCHNCIARDALREER